MRTIRRLIYWMGIRPERGIFFSPTLQVKYTITPNFVKGIKKGYPNFFAASNYTNEFGYCIDPFCDLGVAHRHGMVCRPICICKRKVPNGGQ